jgi:hypothetical protein
MTSLPARLLPLLSFSTLTALTGACDGVDTEPGPDLDVVALEARAGDRPIRRWEFGETDVFLESPALGVTIANESRATSGRVDVTLLGAGAGHFVATGDCRDVYLTARATCSLRVRFQPTLAGVHTATVRVAEEGGASVEVALTGTGTGSGSDPMLTVDPARVDFGPTAKGDDVDDDYVVRPDVHDVAVRNASPRDITDLTVVATGPGFSVEPGGCGATLRAFETCTAKVRLTPTQLGPVTGALEVRGGGRMNRVELVGTGAYYVHVRVWTGDGGDGLLESDPEGFYCDITCEATPPPCVRKCNVLFTGPATITAKPTEDSRFGGWTDGPCAGTQDTTCALPATLDEVHLGGSWRLLNPPQPPGKSRPGADEPTAPVETADDVPAL